ncbi:MAG: 2-oxoglutarate and iron-dependent oxygenase domain-containing protein [Patescibacteria group bacterium]
MPDMQSIVIDVHRDYQQGNATDRTACIERVGKAFYEGVGFVQISSPLSPALYARLYAVLDTLFTLNDEELMRYYSSEHVLKRGYGPLYCETAAGSSVPDIKRLYDIDSAMHRGEPEAERFWVSDEYVPGFRATILEYRNSVNDDANAILEMAAIYAGLPHGTYTQHRRTDSLFTRLIDYPALNTLSDIPQGAVRNREHTDMAAIALVSSASAEGLKAYDASRGKWVAIQMTPNIITANAGETLQYMSRGKIHATRHGVDNDPDLDKGRRVAVNFAWFDPAAELVMTVQEYFDMRTGALRGQG